MPFGIIGTVWSYKSLRDNGIRTPAKNRLVGQPHLRRGTHRAARRHRVWHRALRDTARWAGPRLWWWLLRRRRHLPWPHFSIIENRVAAPMFNLRLFKIRAFFMGSWRRPARPPLPAADCSSCSSSGSRASGCRLHGYSYSDTPLWAGISLLPLTIGFLAGRTDLGLLL